MSDTHLRRLYAEICRGYSETQYAGARAYVKHMSVFDQSEIDSVRDTHYHKAAHRGVKTEADKLKWLEEKKLWTKIDEINLVSQRAYIENLEKTKGKLPIKSQVDQMARQIDEARGKIAAEDRRRRRLIGLTAENVADQRVQYEYIRLSFYQDAALTHPLFDADAIENLSDEEADALLIAYIDVIARFDTSTIRQIVISSFFTQYFSLSDRIETFFARPMYSLTLYQTNLLSYGQYFRTLMTQNDLPKDIIGNPDKIEEYVARSRNLKTLVNKTAGNADRVALIGATADDFKAMGVEDGSAKVSADVRRGVRSGMEAAKTREVTQNSR